MNLEEQELDPMAKDIMMRDLWKHKGSCMFCRAHQQKERKEQSVRTACGPEKDKEKSG